MPKKALNLKKKYHTLRLRTETVNELLDLGSKKETYDDVVMRLVNFFKTKPKQTEGVS